MTKNMRLEVLLPTGILIDQEVVKIIAEAENGSFCLLPHHIDFVTTLVPGVLLFAVEGGHESFAGIDEGTLVKCGADVLVSVRSAVLGEDLGVLRDIVRHEFIELSEHERVARSALARLEAGVARRFIELQK
jgi:F-type H+-transporting ATPase subunit epsilon